MNFLCPSCTRRYGDPLYHGPEGHAPPQLCFDCWANEWGAMAAMMGEEARGRRGSRGKWQKQDLALFYICQGMTKQEASEKAEVHPRTLRRWLANMRQGRTPIPGWLRRWHESA